MMNRQRWLLGLIFRNVILAIAYVSISQLCLKLEAPLSVSSTIWPPAGIALAVLFLGGNRYAPGIFLGAFLANPLFSHSMLGALGIASGDVLEAISGSWLMRRAIGHTGGFDSAEEVFKFVIVSAISAMISAVIGSWAIQETASLASSNFLNNVWIWWIGDLTGILLITPLILSWKDSGSGLPDARAGELALFWLSLVVLSTISLGGWYYAIGSNLLIYLIFSLFIWAGFRFRQRVVTLGSLVISLFAIGNTIVGLGPFIKHDFYESIFLLHLFNLTLALVGLTVSAMVRERLKTALMLRDAHASLEQRVQQRTNDLEIANRNLLVDNVRRKRLERDLQQQQQDYQVIFDATHAMIWYVDREGRILRVNESASRFLGQPVQDLLGQDLHALMLHEFAAQDTLENNRILATGLPILDSIDLLQDSEGKARWYLKDKIPYLDKDGIVIGVTTFLDDIDDIKRAQEKLATTESMFRNLVELSLAGFYMIENERFTYVNPRFAEIFGFQQDELKGSLAVDRIQMEDRNKVQDRLVRHFVGQFDEIRLAFKGLKKDGTEVDIELQGRAVEVNGKREFLGIILDVSEQHKAQVQLNYLAYYDVLTGLPNRALFMEHLGHAMAGVRRHGNMMALLFIDLDRFKEVNDSLGHQVGDLLLQSAALRIRSCLREVDTVARLGGDEFAIIGTDVGGSADAADIAVKIFDALSEPFALSGHVVTTSASVGITLYSGEGDDPNGLLRSADLAMYAAKNNGRGNFQFFSAEMDHAAHHNLAVQAGLRQALELNQFELYYQPRINLSDGAIVGVEALIRWRSPDGTLILPVEFISVAEESGLIVQIGAKVLEMAVSQNLAWQRLGFQKIRMSINLSAVQFRRDDLFVRVRDILQEYGLSGDELELEITESLLMEHTDETHLALMRLREIGVRISIDDFGTGYSSLNYLKKLPVDTLKIDRTFVNDISIDKKNRAIIRSIISLGHYLGLTVVAEGVESFEQMHFLESCGCDELQGYYIGAPMTAQDFEKMLHSGSVTVARTSKVEE